MRKISGLFGALILAIGVASCGGGGDATGTPPPPPPPPPPPTCPANTFCMGSANFVTAAGTTTLSVPANTAVTWTNDSGIGHNVIFDDPATALAVGTGNPGNIPLHTSGSNQRQFAATGNHPFYCSIHGTATTGMHGTVTIQ
ncbi:MAG TPA: plastocyanin/azurin family copper-binding protein [Gemmatimonadaceae bacterium]|nr:plastocyanin/azurin family copper-binding protein [Gemmatimonadaceae bacterium]